MHLSKRTTLTGLAIAALTIGCQTDVLPPVVAPVQTVEAATIPEPVPAVATPSDVADLVARVSASVVNITTLHTTTSAHPFEMLRPKRKRSPRLREGAGTGFIIDAAGYVVTNAHVIQGAEEVRVHMQDDREFAATVIGRDRKLDLALIKITGADSLPTVALGDSEVLRVGESVLAVGNPFGLGHTVTMGIVSAKARAIGASAYDDFIQTDASINPGNSGGPLFNARGEVIGINTAIRAGADGIGFAIPINMLKDVLDQLKEKGFVERGKLGLAFQPVTKEIAESLGLDRSHGALVSDIMPGSAAGRAGLRSGDIIVAIDGDQVVRAEDLPRSVARHAPGSTISVAILRNGAPRTLKAKLDKLAGDEPPAPPRPTKEPPGKLLLGMEVTPARNGGVRIMRFAKPVKGLRVGDVITEVNGKSVHNVDTVRAALKKTTNVKSALFKVRRGKMHRFVGVRVGG